MNKTPFGVRGSVYRDTWRLSGYTTPWFRGLVIGRFLTQERVVDVTSRTFVWEVKVRLQVYWRWDPLSKWRWSTLGYSLDGSNRREFKGWDFLPHFTIHKRHNVKTPIKQCIVYLYKRYLLLIFLNENWMSSVLPQHNSIPNRSSSYLVFSQVFIYSVCIWVN